MWSDDGICCRILAVHSLDSRCIGFFACDMIYPEGRTHFYGQGSADPLRDDISLRKLEAKSARLFCWGLERGKFLVNCSNLKESRLVFPRMPIDALGRGSIKYCERLAEILVLAKRGWLLEASAPFSALREDYWNLVITLEQKKFIRDLDDYWVSVAESIKKVDCLS